MAPAWTFYTIFWVIFFVNILWCDWKKVFILDLVLLIIFLPFTLIYLLIKLLSIRIK